MMHHLDVSVGRGEAVGDLTGPVAATIVDDNHFVIFGHTGKHRDKAVYDSLDVSFFIVRRQKDAQSRQADWYRRWRIFGLPRVCWRDGVSHLSSGNRRGRTAAACPL